MLAPEEVPDSLSSSSFSQASDIVELVVLTSDDLFLQTLREAVGRARRLWHVPSADKVSDLLVAGEVGILVFDVQGLDDTATVFIEQIKRQFPDLVVVVAGNRGAENLLAGLISSGVVYRFIHKPMSPGRAKLFVDAAVKKFDQQRRRATQPPAIQSDSVSRRGWLIGGTIGILAAIVAVTWSVHRTSQDEAGGPHAAVGHTPAVDSPTLAQAAAALAANRLTEPAGDNALELYLMARARNPSDPKAQAGLEEVRERLLARAENALLEERLDEARIAIETARRSGVEGGRITFLTAQLAKSRGQLKIAQAQSRTRNEQKAAEDKVTPWIALANQRIKEGRLIEPEHDSARYFVAEALRTDPTSLPAQDVQRTLAVHLLSQARGAIDRRDFTRAASWLEAAKGIATAANIKAVDALLSTARHHADSDTWSQLLKNAADRLRQDRLIDPPNDSAKYYLLTLRGVDPSNAGLAPAMQDLGARLVAKARRAMTLEQYDAARSWLNESASIGFTSAESSEVEQDLQTALAKQKFLTNIVAANDLTLLKSVEPVYPRKAEAQGIQGWVEMDFTVTESGAVKDITIHALSTPGTFENAAVNALSQWRYKPVIRDSKAVAQRARIRIRFKLDT